jgi:hypothetical protein
MIRQRVLYVGIGGSGLDLGIRLDEALRHQVCGLDGRALVRKGGPFAGFQPNQLPNFIQSVYIDFAAESLEGVTSAIKGGNTHAIADLIPTVDNYPTVAMDLRMKCDEETIGWIPPQGPDEPPTKPLNGGAGQFPTIGRAAMFHSIEAQGYEASLGSKLRRAIKGLEGGGQIDSYTNNRSLKSIAVYVGFSLSGGTGCGLFMDVLYLLTRELMRECPDNPCVIIPIVMLPSTFGTDLPPDKFRRARLNAAPAVLDLVRLLEQLHRPKVEWSKDFEIRYPDPVLGRVGIEFRDAAPMIPVVSVVAKGGDMERDDVMRSVASAVVSHASSVVISNAGTGVGIKNENSFIEGLINDIPEISRPHPLGLGTHPLMPMVASSLTMPSRQLADLLAQRAVHDGLSEIFKGLQDTATPSQDHIDEFLNHCGLVDLVKANTFSADTNLSFTVPQSVNREADLEKVLVKVRRDASNAEPIIQKRIEETIKQNSVFKPVENGLSKLLLSNPDMTLPQALIVGLAALTQLETRSGKVGIGNTGVAKTGKPKSKSGVFSKVLPSKVSSKSAAQAMNAAETAYVERVRDMWWTQWGQLRRNWLGSVEAGREGMLEISAKLHELETFALANVASDQMNLAQRQKGVVNFVPTEGRSFDDFFEVLYERTTDRVREIKSINAQSASALLSVVATSGDQTNAWSEFVNAYSQLKSKTSIFETVLSPMRNLIEQAMTGDGSSRAGTLKGLNTLLLEATQPQRSNDSDSLLGALGDLVPDTMIPTGEHRIAKVLISYPGERNEEVEKLITSKIRLGASFAALLDKPSTKVTYTATGEGDVITVNVNLVGQGVLDHPETREVLRFWVDALDNPQDDQLLWRQRLGYQTTEQLFSRASRDSVMLNLIRGLALGQMKITKGTPYSPERLEIGNERTAGSNLTHVEFDVQALEGMSSWPNVLSAFERYVLTLDSQRDARDQVLKKVMTTAPSVTPVTIPQIVVDLFNMRDTEIAKIDAHLAESEIYTPVKIRRLVAARYFWSNTLSEAFKLPIDQEFASLEVAIRNMQK